MFYYKKDKRIQDKMQWLFSLEISQDSIQVIFKCDF